MPNPITNKTRFKQSLSLILFLLFGLSFSQLFGVPAPSGKDLYRVTVLGNGTIILYKNNERAGMIHPQLFGEKWAFIPFDCCGKDPRFNAMAEVNGQGRVGLSSSAEVGKNSIHVHYRMTALKDLKIINARAVLFLPADNWDKAPYQWGTAKGVISLTEKNKGVVLATADSVPATFGPSLKDGLKVIWSGEGLHGVLQDNRKWTPHLILRWDHGESTDHTWLWKAGETKYFDFTLEVNRDIETSVPASSEGASGLGGTWSGDEEIQEMQSKYRVSMTLTKDARGRWDLHYNSIDEGKYNARVDGKLAVKGKTLDLVSSEGFSMAATLDPSGQSLDGSITSKYGTHPIHFHRGEDYNVPRLDAQGLAVTQYIYQVPQTLSDGWPVGDLRQSPLDPAKVGKGVEEVLNGRVPNIESMVLVQNGKLLLDEYFRSYGPGDEHMLQSVTKSVLSTLFGIAQDQGLVNVSEKLYDYFPEYRTGTNWQADKDKITLADVLSMSSGFSCDDWVGDENTCGHEMWPSPDWLSFVLNLRLDHAPGDHFAYCTSCLEPLGAIIARKSGMSLPDFAQKYLYDPLVIQDRHWWIGPKDVTEVGGSHWLRPRDMAKLGQLYLQKGKWNGRQVVSAKWVEEATRPQAPNPPDNPRYFEYGYFWWQEKMPYQDGTTPVFYAAGKGGQYIFVAPNLNLVFVTTAANYEEYDLALLSKSLFKAYVLGAFK